LAGRKRRWKIRADKPLLRDFSFLMKPLFSANHHWAMRKGEESLRLELARRPKRALACQRRRAQPFDYSRGRRLRKDKR